MPGAVLTQRAQCTLSIRFTPGGSGQRQAELNIGRSLLYGIIGGDRTRSYTPIKSPPTDGTICTSGEPCTYVTSGDQCVYDWRAIAPAPAPIPLWTAATTQPANTRVKALLIQPGDGSKLYAATYGGGVFKSADSGVNWSACATQPANLNLLSLTMDASGKLYVGSEAALLGVGYSLQKITQQVLVAGYRTIGVRAWPRRQAANIRPGSLAG